MLAVHKTNRKSMFRIVMFFVFFCCTSLRSSTSQFPTVVNFADIKLFQDRYLYDKVDSWTWQLGNSALDLGYIAFNDSPEIGTFMTILKEAYAIDTVVETGTYFGASTLFFSLNFDEVHTIEAEEKFYHNVKDRLREHSNIHFHFGSSEKILPKILPSLEKKRVLFYLDAHSYYLEAEKGGYHYWPILEELEAISKTHHDHCVIVIDDVQVPNTDIHGCVDLNGKNELSHELIRDQLEKVFSRYGFHYLIPKNPSRAAKLVVIPKKWENPGYSGRVDILPGLNLNELPINYDQVKLAGYEIRVSNQFYNGQDQGNYAEEIRHDLDLKKIIVFNNTVDPYYLSKFPKDKLVLFLLEPLHLPDSYYEPCSRVYTWNDDLVDGVKFFKLYYPYLRPMQEDLPSFEEKKLCVMVSGSDNTYPERPNELYSERMKMVEFFETKPEGEFDIYGRYWVKRHYRDFRGYIPGDYAGDEKIATLKKYRFCVCFENTKNLNGYITEKIFGCFAAGCVPIYWGANNIEKYIPKNCFIDYRDFTCKESLYQFIKTMPKDVYEKYLENIRAFLKNNNSHVFCPKYFGQLLYEAIQSPK